MAFTSAPITPGWTKPTSASRQVLPMRGAPPSTSPRPSCPANAALLRGAPSSWAHPACGNEAALFALSPSAGCV